ncbi:Uncharacterised protein [Mycobacterium tuberculosis]|nr:Uncharacterised protein [Mycobacterium tuberculosis]
MPALAGSWWCGRSPRLTTHVRRPSSSGRRSHRASGTVAGAVRSRCQLAANPGCNGKSATSFSATQRSSALSRLGTVSSNSPASATTVV